MLGEPLRLSYRLQARRVGRRWELDVPGVDGVVAVGRTLDIVTAVTRRLIADAVGVSPDDVEVVVEAAPS